MPAMLMSHEGDPAHEIHERIAAVGGLTGFELFGNQVLLAVYERPKVTKSGIHLADVTLQEDSFQGKAGLVLATGPAAFKSDANYDFMGQGVKPGDWVAIFVSDGRKIMIGKQACRLVQDQHVRLRIPAPDVVY